MFRCVEKKVYLCTPLEKWQNASEGLKSALNAKFAKS